MQVVHARPAPVAPAATSLYVRSGGLVRRLALSFDALAADIYWIRAIQHFGSTRRSSVDGEKRYEQLYPLLDIATTLDPLFNIAYRFGAIFLAEPPPGGPGRSDLAIELLEKGIAARPDRWQYMQDVGFIHYWWRRDYRTAAEWFLRASEVPGASWWLRTLAADTLAAGGDRETSRLLWRELATDPENQWLRQEAQRRLAQIDALDVIDQLSRSVERFAARTGAYPTSWEQLRDAGEVPGIPVDPAGAPYVLGVESPRVSVSPASPLYPLPGDEQPAGGR
jgi:tetratricopeptide (TPR) repeat protein